MIRHVLPEEDSFRHHPQVQAHINIALVLYPYASHLDEFDALINQPGINVVPVRGLVSLKDFQAIILPGSKNVGASLDYLREKGFDSKISEAAECGILIFGVCGGMQLLRSHDP